MPVHPLIRDNLAAIEQGTSLLAGLDERLYADATLSGASIGAHFRHVLDHYQCLLKGVASGVVDYDARERDGRIETDRDYALAVAARIRQALLALEVRAPLSVQLHAGPSAQERLDPTPSTVERELLFVLLHSVHHYALIALELKMRGKRPDPTLGMAPATLGYASRGR